MTDTATLAALALATLASEDLAAVAAAALAAEGRVGAVAATAAVGAGIYVGDLLLFLCGRLGAQVPFVRSWLTRRVGDRALCEAAAALDRRLPLAIATSRVVPGSRLAMYVAAGMFSRRPLAFCLWTLAAVLTWTPLLIAVVHTFGAGVVSAGHSYARWLPAAAVLVALHVVFRARRRRTT